MTRMAALIDRRRATVLLRLVLPPLAHGSQPCRRRAAAAAAASWLTAPGKQRRALYPEVRVRVGVGVAECVPLTSAYVWV